MVELTRPHGSSCLRVAAAVLTAALLTGSCGPPRSGETLPVRTHATVAPTAPGASACWPHQPLTPTANVDCWVRYLASPALGGRDNLSPGGALAAEAIAGAFDAAGLKPISGKRRQPFPRGVNILGTLPGTAPALHDNMIVVGAHFDHIGVVNGQAFLGANDNASGVAALIEMIRLLKDKRLRRSVVFVAFDAEEPPDYLTETMGSRWFVDHLPIPRASLNAMVAIDLAGGDLWEGAGGPLFVLGLETFTLPPQTPKEAGGYAVRSLHLRAIEDLPTGRQSFSDYGAFYDIKVPVIFGTTGRSPHYHQPSDTPENVSAAKVVALAESLVALVRELDRHDTPPRWRHDAPLTREDARTVAHLWGLALGSSPSPRVPKALRPTAGLIHQRIVEIARGTGELPAAEAAAVVRASLAFQCLHSDMPPAACLR